jgi:hypothetical protein
MVIRFDFGRAGFGLQHTKAIPVLWRLGGGKGFPSQAGNNAPQRHTLLPGKSLGLGPHIVIEIQRGPHVAHGITSNIKYIDV